MSEQRYLIDIERFVRWTYDNPKLFNGENSIYSKSAVKEWRRYESLPSKKIIEEINSNYLNGEKTFERAEMKMQSTVIDNLIKRNDLQKKVDLLIGGELSNQLSLTNFTLSKYHIPFLGVYSACASFNEALIIMSNFLESKKILIYKSPLHK